MPYFIVVLLLFCFVSCDEVLIEEGPIKLVSVAPQWVTDKDIKDGHFHGVTVQTLNGRQFSQVVEDAQVEAKAVLLEQLKIELNKTSTQWAITASKIEGIAFTESYLIDASKKVLSTIPNDCHIVQEASWKDVEKNEYWVMLTADYPSLSKQIDAKIKSFMNRIFPKGLKEAHQKLSDAEIKEEKKRAFEQGFKALDTALKNLQNRRGGKS